MTTQAALYAHAKRFIAGGVNSPVRAFKSVGGTPIFFESGSGAWLTDTDGRQYVDYVGAWGPLIVGHAHPAVVAAITKAAAHGSGFGAPTVLETQLAEQLCTLLPALSRVRMVNSGTEATMSAIRLARGVSGRHRIVKFSGCYHGHVDALLVEAGSGALTLGVPTSPGISNAVTELTIVLPYNRSDALEAAFSRHGDDIAAVIVEPVAGNMSCVPPLPGFLQDLRRYCDAHASLLIFDEVMTGFRVGPQSAQGLYQVFPDMTTLGKVIGGGLPVGAFGGSADLMAALAPDGAIYQAGTLSGNPIAMAAGLATLELVQVPGFYQRLAATTRALCDALAQRAAAAGIALRTHAVGGMFGLFFTEKERICYLEDVMQCDSDRFNRFFHGMLAEGVYFAPSAFESGFVSSAHDDGAINHTLCAAERVFKTLQ